MWTGLKQLLGLCTVVLMVVMATEAQGVCLKFETYNTGLTPNEKEKEKRLPGIVQALRTSDSDVLCLQEVWMEKDMREITQSLNPSFPYQFSSLHVQNTNQIRQPTNATITHGACSVDEANKLSRTIEQCLLDKGCRAKNYKPRLECLVDKCARHLFETTQSCASCLILNSIYGVSNLLKWCTTNQDENNRLNGPGLLMLSRTEIVSAVYKPFFPGKRMSQERGYILATDANGIKSVCTQLTYPSHKFYFEYELNFASSIKQQKKELEKLIADFEGDDVILLGNLNVGLNQYRSGRYFSAYSKLIRHGYRSPYVEQNGPCTRCQANRYNSRKTDVVLDHIMVKGESLTPCGEVPFRLYDDPRDSEGLILSTNYGIKVRVCHKPAASQ